jgi:hypothetical protein
MVAVWYWLHVNRGGLWAENPKILDFEIGSGDVRLYNSPEHHDDFIINVKTTSFWGGNV